MSKFILTNILLVSALSAVSAQNSLTVNISNITTKKGQIEIGLFNKEKNFLKNGAQFLKRKINVKGNKLNYTFENLPKGNYAIAVFHDENGNNKCDTNLIGIPVEGYGFSNNFKPKVSAPKFEQTKVYVDRPLSIDIKLIN